MAVKRKDLVLEDKYNPNLSLLKNIKGKDYFMNSISLAGIVEDSIECNSQYAGNFLLVTLICLHYERCKDGVKEVYSRNKIRIFDKSIIRNFMEKVNLNDFIMAKGFIDGTNFSYGRKPFNDIVVYNVMVLSRSKRLVNRYHSRLEAQININSEMRKFNKMMMIPDKSELFYSSKQQNNLES